VVKSQVAKESGSLTSASLNSVAVTILQQFEDNVRKQLSELSSLEEGLSPERYKAIFPPMEKEQRYIMSHTSPLVHLPLPHSSLFLQS
jgi:hypothetical protein